MFYVVFLLPSKYYYFTCKQNDTLLIVSYAKHFTVSPPDLVSLRPSILPSIGRSIFLDLPSLLLVTSRSFLQAFDKLFNSTIYCRFRLGPSAPCKQPGMIRDYKINFADVP